MKVLLASLFMAAPLLAQNAATLDDTAKVLAGMPVAGPLEPLTHDGGWQEHATAMDDAWAKKQRRQIGPISEWMQQNAEQYYRSTSTMYYMFSGPDFLYANIFFPHANTYILAGLEPVGNVPDLTTMPPDLLRTDLAALRGSLSSVLRFQYFITKDMRAELGRGNISGTLPILYVFLARLGYTVIDATHVSSPADGVKITFANGDERQTLYYFKTDLSGGNSGFLKWCAARGPGLSLLKAASYLLHGDGFAGVRNFLLEHSRVIVQDDSGIPLRAFPKNWSVNLYGRYVPHTEEFAKYMQPDLAALYAKDPVPSPLGFAFGYHWQKESGILMLATRDAPRATLVEPAAAAKTERPKTSRRSRGAPRPAGARE
ncbi:MAG: hypothetical protein M3Z64_03110 [Verrucomicrobiota bacterium]|nr:hypothetical protein [Verrucomicrobiota bacterium]